MGYSIYYHFFDRELKRSISASLTDEELVPIVLTSMFMTDNLIYLPMSHIYESADAYPKAISLLLKMESIGLLTFASSHESYEGFLVSRQKLYKFDEDRYPMYFTAPQKRWSSDIVKLNDSTTDILRADFFNLNIDIKEFSGSQNKDIKDVVNRSICRSDDAVTFSLFEKELSNSPLCGQGLMLAQHKLKHYISYFYTKRYLNIQNATIITNIHGFETYDELARKEVSTDFLLYHEILANTGFNINQNTDVNFCFLLRNSQGFKAIQCLLEKYTSAIESFSQKNGNFLKHHFYLKEYLNCNIRFEVIKDDKSLLYNLYQYFERLMKKHPEIKSEVDEMHKETSSVVVIAATDTEMKQLLEVVKEKNNGYIIIEKIDSELIYRELIGGNRPVYFVQSQMGMTGTGAIINTMHKVCKLLNPKYVIMGGIGFGINKERQAIGDVLISNQVWNYELAKVESDKIISRGDKIPASSYLLQLFHSSAVEYTDCKIRFGLIASGEKLVNSDTFKNQLLQQERELIGGDMEAAGLASVCTAYKIDWIVAKSICDWGSEKSDDYQEIAAKNSFQFIIHNVMKIIA